MSRVATLIDLSCKKTIAAFFVSLLWTLSSLVIFNPLLSADASLVSPFDSVHAQKPVKDIGLSNALRDVFAQIKSRSDGDSTGGASIALTQNNNISNFKLSAAANTIDYPSKSGTVKLWLLYRSLII